MPDDQTPELSPAQQQIIEAQRAFEAELSYTLETSYRDIIKAEPTAADWLKVATAVIDRYEHLQAGTLRVPFRAEAPATNIIQMGSPPVVATITAPTPLQSFMPGTAAGWSVQVFGKGSGGAFTQMEFDIVFTNGAVSNHNLVRLADLAAAIVIRDQIDSQRRTQANGTEPQEGE